MTCYYIICINIEKVFIHLEMNSVEPKASDRRPFLLIRLTVLAVLTFITWSLGSRLQSAKVSVSPSRKRREDTVRLGFSSSSWGWGVSRNMLSFTRDERNLLSITGTYKMSQRQHSASLMLVKALIQWLYSNSWSHNKRNNPAASLLFKPGLEFFMYAENFWKMSSPALLDSLFRQDSFGYLPSE